MSSLVNKVKEVLHSDKDKDTTHTTGTHSTTHNTSHTVGSTEPRVDPTHHTTTTGAGTGYAGTDNYTYGSGANRGADGPATRTDGPHNSNLANKADPRVDSDRDGSRNLGANPHGTATTGNTTSAYGTSGTGHSTVGGTTTGLSGTGTNRGVDGPATRTDGPHSSNLANKLDPRVDSDRDHSRNLGANPQGTATTGSSGYNTTTGHSTTGHSTTGHSAIGGAGTGFDGANRGLDGPATRTDGPHSSNLANKADPRVDSDRDHSRNLGANPQGTATTGTSGIGSTTTGHSTTGHSTTGHSTTGHSAVGGTTGLGSTGTNRGVDGPATRTDGPHSSNLANKADPRVDSDRDHSRNLGANPHGTATTGTSGYGSSTGHTGTHTTGTHHTGTHTAGTHSNLTSTSSGPGPAPNTAGPHKSDFLNKADPRVDSDLDGSKTVGGNKTYAQS